MISDFRAAGSSTKHDILDLGDLLETYTGANPIDDYLRLAPSGGGTEVQIDVSGKGTSFRTVAVLAGITGLAAQSAIDSGLVVL